MTDAIAFDTPENIQVRYRPAGLGTRFIAWVIDQTLAVGVELGLLIVALVTVSSLAAFRDWRVDADQWLGYFVGVMFVIFGLGNLLYYTFFELLMRGQTPGKRWCGIQVVKADGFGLDAGGIVVRNIFRLIDSIPLTWVVPLLSKRSQRLGDMVAGTVVVSEQRPQFSYLRALLAQRPAGDARYRFSSVALARLPRRDVDAVEKLLERWNSVAPEQRTSLARRLADAIAARLAVEPPPADGEQAFLLDLLTAELRRRERGLG